MYFLYRSRFLSNYYTGYMICLFLGLYFPYAYLMINDSFSWKSFIKQFGRFIFYSVLSVGLITVILLPTFYSLLGSKGTATTIAWSLKSEYNPLLMASKLFIGSFDFHEMQKGYPNIFVGSLASLVSFATSKRKNSHYPNAFTHYSLRLSSSSASILRCLINCGMRVNFRIGIRTASHSSSASG